MLYTGFREIDDNLGGIENGELVVIATDLLGEYVQNYILYNLANQIDGHNRQNIKNYDKKINAFIDYKDVEFEHPIEKIVVLGINDLEFNALSGFPCGTFQPERFNLFQKKMILFKNLPIEQNIYYLYQRSAKSLIEDITSIYEDIKTQISAICVFGWRQKLPMLKEVAQKLNIPVFVLTYIGLSKGIESKIRKYKEQSAYIDKWVIVENNCWHENSADLPHATTTFLLADVKSDSVTSVISDYYPYLFKISIPDYKPKYHLKPKEYNNQFLITLKIDENKATDWEKFKEILKPWTDKYQNIDEPFMHDEQNEEFRQEKNKALNKGILNLFIKINELNKLRNVYCYSPNLLLEYPLLSCVFGFTDDYKPKLFNKKVAKNLSINDIIIFTDMESKEVKNLFADGTISKVHELKSRENLILAEMARYELNINKYNFSKYMHLPRKKMERFWAYIEVFQRIELEDLYELIAEYKNGKADKQELMLAAVILRKLLVGNQEQITITEKSNEE
ncbi:MAG: hypothetical protein IJ184_02900 [Alphaproteobacteria bacterium]|nr:hypothetical protein [Alphaproteobacteria bacterium]